ncbi:MAG: methylated-DNA--[protein]-cysteine S-methyltransferase [Chloroflexota bacterium]
MFRTRDRREREPEPDAIIYTSVPSPLGTLWIAGSDDAGIMALSYGIDEPAFLLGLEARGEAGIEYDAGGLRQAAIELEEFFAGTRTQFDLRLDLRGLTAFQRVVLTCVAGIPYGRVRSYGDIAAQIGRPRASRAVGHALSSSPIAFLIPCHRVIRSDGSLGGYGSGACGGPYKRMLLEREGTRF